MSDICCSDCKSPKIEVDFYKKSGCKLGRRSECRDCTLKRKHKFYEENKEQLNARTIKFYYDNWKARRETQRLYFQNNKRSIANQRKIKYQTNLLYRLQHNLRSRLTQAVKNHQKSGSALGDLGCTVEEFKLYIEKQFQVGMTWENWGLRGWHIDHKIPVSKFDLSNPIELKVAVHFTNLQPLWAKDNLRKGDSII